MHNDLIAFGVLGIYIIIDIAKHIITLAFRLLNNQFEKNNKE